MLFGEFLLGKGVLDEAAIVAALDIQQRNRPFIGALAVEEGCLTVEQVLAVLDAQIDDRRNFGQIALALQFLDEDALDRIIALRRSAIPPLGQILVEQGAVGADEMQALLDEFFAASRKDGAGAES